MSLVQIFEEGYIISHCCFINEVYASVKESDEKEVAFGFNESLFRIGTQFLKDGQKQKKITRDGLHKDVNNRKKIKRDVNISSEGNCIGEIEHVQRNAEKIVSAGRKCGCWDLVASEDGVQSNNLEARQAAESFYHKESKLLTGSFHGGNLGDVAVISSIQGDRYLIPPACKFFCYDVREIQKHRHLLDDSYDFILLDPPWWNKYIRRKKLKSGAADGYQMMYDEDVARLPLASLAAPGTLVALWCTNSDSHLSAIRDALFPAWGVTYIGKWYWLKVTCGGEAVCAYSKPPGKQPFEQIVFGWFQAEGRPRPLPEDGRVLVSVPSALHSHKPPLADVLAKYLPPSPRSLELFARYLLPGYTSWGSEVLKLQQICLYKQLSS
ncbi:N(6)-adenine-specific methyltransferase METTL4 [Bacillus rossius redtenbacheri]|uniref:N(6)-adenine-specific methyltransferase METTL4 n=1 Tax=Bacillus rossius redtenbacheri TaxID=93214 RepID=UPI002FDCCE60